MAEEWLLSTGVARQKVKLLKKYTTDLQTFYTVR